jgi:hypothetical protein
LGGRINHRFVLDPDLDYMERTPIAVEAVPTGALGDRLHGDGIGRGAEHEMRRSIAARVFF